MRQSSSNRGMTYLHVEGKADLNVYDVNPPLWGRHDDHMITWSHDHTISCSSVLEHSTTLNIFSCSVVRLCECSTTIYPELDENMRSFEFIKNHICFATASPCFVRNQSSSILITNVTRGLETGQDITLFFTACVPVIICQADLKMNSEAKYCEGWARPSAICYQKTYKYSFNVFCTRNGCSDTTTPWWNLRRLRHWWDQRLPWTDMYLFWNYISMGHSPDASHRQRLNNIVKRKFKSNEA